MILSSATYWLWPAWFWVLAGIAVSAYVVPVFWRTLSVGAVRSCLALAWLAHGLVVGLALFSGRFGFGPAISVMAWLMLTVYAIESRMYPQLQSRRVLAALGAVAVLLGMAFPGTSMSAKASVWLPLHGALGIAAYGMLALATVHGWLLTRAELQIRIAGSTNDTPKAGLPLMTLERLMFAFAWASFALLTATLLAGWFFGEDLYGAGQAWIWNHKTIFSVLAWLVLAMLLWGRVQRGWRGKRAAHWVYGGATLLLLAYVGSRFVLEVLLQRSL